MKSRFFTLLLCLLTAIALIGCGGGGSSDGGVATGTIKGKIVDTAGAAVAGATITDGNKTGTSAGDGTFTLEGVVSAAEVKLTVSKDGYLNTYAFEPLAAGQTVDHNYVVRAIPAGVTANLAGLTGAAQSAQPVAGGVKIDFPQNSIVDAAGNPVDAASVKIVHTKPTDAKSLDTFPGTFEGFALVGATENLQTTATPIETFGFVYVDLGNNKLDPTKPATINIPLDPGATTTDLQMPLWHFDTDDGKWKQVGTATRNAVNDPFTATVKHFSWYNLDKPVAVSSLEITVASYSWTWEEMEGNTDSADRADLTKRIANARVEVKASLATENGGRSFFGSSTNITDNTWMAVQVTDSQGVARFNIPTGRMINITVSANGSKVEGYGYEVDGTTAKSFINMGANSYHQMMGKR